MVPCINSIKVISVPPRGDLCVIVRLVKVAPGLNAGYERRDDGVYDKEQCVWHICFLLTTYAEYQGIKNVSRGIAIIFLYANLIS